MALDRDAAVEEPITIRFDGLDADSHEIELTALAEALRGLSRIIAVTSNFAVTQKYSQHRDALAVRIVARPAEAHCYEVVTVVKWMMSSPLFPGVVAPLTVLLITYVFKRAAGQHEEMKQLRGALDEAIKQLGTRDQGAVDKLLATIDKMADALRPAARQAVAPLGETARTLTVGTGAGMRAFVDEADKAAITARDPVDVDIEKTYTVVLTELDIDTGSCRLRLPDDAEARHTGKITDPLVGLPNNPYALALASQDPLAVRAKATLREGEIDRLFISDLA